MPEEQIDSDKIAENAQAPKRVTGDSGSVEQHSIADQIAADRYARNRAAAGTNPFGAIRRVKMVPPGAD